MPDWTRVALQVKGKTRRFVQSTLIRRDTEARLAQRQGSAAAAARAIEPARE